MRETRQVKYGSKDMYGYDDDDMDNEIIDEYRQCEWTCNCGCSFNTEEGIIDNNVLSCPACGEEIEREDYE